MRKHIPIILGETALFAGAGVMEALGFSVPLWVWATLLTIGVGGLIVYWAVPRLAGRSAKPARVEDVVERVLHEKNDAQMQRTAEAIALQYMDDPQERERRAEKLSEKWEKEAKDRLAPNEAKR